MESPIQLKFFKKLELWQEVRSQNKKSLNRDEIWLVEKEILKWTRYNHHHLGTSLTIEFIGENIIPKEMLIAPIVDVKKTMENLVARKYAVFDIFDSSDSSILVTLEGLLMGEVLDDTEGDKKNIFAKYKYTFYYYFVWTVVMLGALTVIITFLHSI